MALILHISILVKKKKHPKGKTQIPLPANIYCRDNTLSVCMIVKNEEKCLPLILSDIQGLADELIIVDTGSTDGTVSIAQQMGARVVFHTWTGDFSAARNRSAEEARSSWIMWLDADDRMLSEDIKRLKVMKHTLQSGYVYTLEVVNQIADGFSPPFKQTRIFPNDRRLRFENRVHESITMSARKHGFKTMHLSVRVIHTGYIAPEDILKKMERNMFILEQELAENPDAITLRFLYANTLIYFNRLHEAQLHYERIISTPNARGTQCDVYYGALVAMAQTHNLLNNHQEAEMWAMRAVNDRPQGMQGWYHWGKALMHLGQKEEALEKIYRALECKSLMSSVQVDYNSLRISCLEAAASLLSSLKRHEEAEKLLKNALKDEALPEISELLDKLQNKPMFSEADLLRGGQELLAKHAYIEASKIFIRIIEANPRCFEALNSLGLISWYFGKYDDAYVLFRKAVETGPENEDILLNVWDAAQMIGQSDDARIILQKALIKNPGMMKIKELLEG